MRVAVNLSFLLPGVVGGSEVLGSTAAGGARSPS